ncbi:hypothetical protein F0562_031290 [Nyssa sinensis]|uniref:Sialate O-acetylesterase domain-containing protein n=1 Tax=Nyssa sinensis TaxID=561372 RepID=A0A5J5ARY9_9ASTE|nr:hypothetical protein F0562_031290 [Nyssa sinensis]
MVVVGWEQPVTIGLNWGGVNKQKHWDGVVSPECRLDHSILRLNAHLHWKAAYEPLYADIDTKKACGVGLGMSFTNVVKEREGVVGLVPCAVGGTAIKEWARGSHLYEGIMKRGQGIRLKAETERRLRKRKSKNKSKQRRTQRNKAERKEKKKGAAAWAALKSNICFFVQ